MSIRVRGILTALCLLICVGCSPAFVAPSYAVWGGAALASQQAQPARTREITKGSFRSLTIGDSKDQALSALREMGATRIMPGFGEQAPVTRGSVAHDEPGAGYLHMNLDFAHGTLRRISVLEAPAAL